MEKIDNKIDILLRQKLLMNYNPSMNLTENINTYSNKNSVIESKSAVVKKIRDAASNALKSFGGKSVKVGKFIGKGLVNISGAIFNRYTLARIWKISPVSISASFIYFVYRLVRRSNTELYKDDIVGIFAQCKKVLDTPTDAHIKQAEQLNYALNEGFKIGRLGVDVKEVTRIFQSIDTIGELCLVNNAFNTKYASTGQRGVLVKQLLSYDNFDATVRTKALANVLNNLKSGIDTVEVDCVQHLLIKNRLSFTTERPYVQIKETLNPDLQKHGGIIIYEGNKWKTTDGKINGEYSCDTENPKEIQFRSGSCVYYITESEKAKEGCIGKKDVAATSPDKSADSTAAAGSSGAIGSTATKLCPTGYSPPIGGVYKQCTIGEPIKVVQRCLGGLVDDGKFGIKTLNQLRVLKGTEQFTEEDIPKICAVQANTTVPAQSDTPPVAATIKPKYQPLDVVPIGPSSDNLYAERF
jgi:hypothetical protein